MAPSVINLNDTTPVAPAGRVNVAWQGDTNNPRNVSANIKAPRYDIWWAFSGANYPISTTYLIGTFPVPVTFAANFTGSYGGNLPTGNASVSKTFNILKISGGTTTTIGTASVSRSGVWTFTTTAGATQSFLAGDMIAIQTPSSSDATLADFGVTLVGTP